jgi:hypothetical protein
MKAATISPTGSAHSPARRRAHRLATLATVLAGQRDAENATGMESPRIHERIIAVRDAIEDMSDGRASAGLTERCARFSLGCILGYLPALRRNLTVFMTLALPPVSEHRIGAAVAVAHLQVHR